MSVPIPRETEGTPSNPVSGATDKHSREEASIAVIPSPCYDDPDPRTLIPAEGRKPEAKGDRGEPRRRQRQQKTKKVSKREIPSVATGASCLDPSGAPSVTTRQTTPTGATSPDNLPFPATAVPVDSTATASSAAEKGKQPQQEHEADGPPPQATKNAPADDARGGQAGHKSPSSPRADVQQHESGGASPLKRKKEVADDKRRAHAGPKFPSWTGAKVRSLKVPSPKPQKKKGDAIAGLNALLARHSLELRSASPVTPVAPPWLKWEVPAYVTVLAVVLLFGVVTALVMFLFPSPPKAVRTFCMTEDCVKHRQLLENQLDKTIDACEDFGAYVCRQWLPRKEFAELSRSMIWDMVMSWLSRLPDTLTKSAARLPVANKAAAMFNSCVTQVGSGATVIKDFMHAHGIAWPEDPDGSIKPLEALFDLSFNWRVHLWLRLNVLAVTRHYNRRLIIVSPNDMLALWWRVFRQIPKERFDTVYRAFFKMFAKNATIRPRAQDINATQELLEIVFQTFLPAAKWNARSPKLLSLRELDRHSSVAIGERLMHSLNSVLRIDPPVTMDDLVLLSDDAILEGTFVLIGIYGDEYVLKQLSWLFMQACAVVADPAKVLVVLHGNKHHGLAQLPRFCARQVEDSYKLMVSAMASVAHFADDERRRIDDFLAEIRQMALSKTLASAWLDNATSELAADKLKNVEAVLWPAEKFLTTRALGDIYAHFPETGAWFANFWIESRRSQRGLFGSEAGVEEQRIRDSMAPPYIEFVHGLNKLSLSIGALAPPLYYPNGTNAMLYGGLGYFYAKGLLEAIDDDGIRVDPAGTIGSSWLSEESEAAFMKRIDRRKGVLHQRLPAVVHSHVPKWSVWWRLQQGGHEFCPICKSLQLCTGFQNESCKEVLILRLTI